MVWASAMCFLYVGLFGKKSFLKRYFSSKSSEPLLQRLRFRDRFFDTANHVEGLLRQRIVLAADDALEAADGVLQRDDLAVLTGEHLRDVERLRQEALHLARTEHH